MDDISFTVPAGHYAVLMGKTGTGKTTLLEIICGLRTPEQGTVWLGERDVTKDVPGDRGLGYVPQDGALFPTMTVRQQIGFGLRMKKTPVAEIDQVVAQLADETGIAHLLERRALHELVRRGKTTRGVGARACVAAQGAPVG